MKQKKPIISIVVPVYNAEQYLRRCLESIVNQTYTNLDIILINDGSTDLSLEICRQYMQRDSRIQLFCQKNSGASAARNTGLEHMRGEYVVFVDADDYISLYFVESLLKQIQAYQVSIVMCDYVVLDEDRAQMDEDHFLPETVQSCSRLVSREEVYDNMLKEHEGVRFCVPWGKLYHKNIFCGVRFEEVKIYEDLFIFHKIYEQVETVCCIDVVLYYYVRSCNSVTRKDGITQINIEEADGLMKRLEYFHEQKKEKYVRMVAFEIMWIAFHVYNHSGEEDRSVRRKLKEVQNQIFQITKKNYWPFKLRLYMICPVLYHALRNCIHRSKI